MEIIDIRIHTISAKLSKTFWMSIEPYTTASEIIVEVETDTGIVGIGEIHRRPLDEISKVLNRFKTLLVGQDPMAHERIWQQLFNTTVSQEFAEMGTSFGQPHFGQGIRPQVLAAIAGIDIALWDIKGKVAEQPIYKLLGGNNSVPCYASGGYYYREGDEVGHLVDEMTGYVRDQGYSAVKMKVGGLPLEGDTARVRAVRESLPDVKIMLDANGAYDVRSAIEAASAFEPFDIYWFEEPVHWYDSVRGLGEVARNSRISIASGESELHRWACRDLIDLAGIRYMQFDATRAGGVTEWLRIAGHASSNSVLMAPHHDPQIHGHLVSSVPNGHILETFPNPERDPLWDELFSSSLVIENGELLLPDKPGFGFELNMEVLRKYDVKPAP
jgi:L-alanine-DL-glutamate epimerase-like enolase superfamily enzyme